MCNSAVTCGVSFTEKLFTKSFIAKASWNNPRDLVQFSFRVRNFGGDNTIDIIELGGSISPKDSKVLIADDPVYRGLIADVNFEQLTTNDDCFRNFIAPLDRSCVGEEPAIIPSCDDIMGFKEVEWRINARDATTAMRLSMEKFYFEVMFKPCTPKGSIGALWDNGKQNFVTTLHNGPIKVFLENVSAIHRDAGASSLGRRILEDSWIDFAGVGAGNNTELQALISVFIKPEMTISSALLYVNSTNIIPGTSTADITSGINGPTLMLEYSTGAPNAARYF
eukprot:jgi/Tetstr1/424237/TSEL_001430.t1